MRVVRITSQDEVGTGTIIDFEDHQYLLTAAHVVKHVHAGQKLHIAVRWNQTGTVDVVRKEARSDTAVILLKQTFTLPRCEFGGSLYQGQDVFLLGFPAGQGHYIDIEEEGVRNKELSPFARKGAISTITSESEIIVDSLLQKGFSGGPLVVGSSGQGDAPKVVGTISSGLLFQKDKQLLDDNQGVTIRSGFTVCQSPHIAIGIMRDFWRIDQQA